jgi:heterodisulfide reductase subunit A
MRPVVLKGVSIMIASANNERRKNTVVIGGGIAGLQAALDLADQGYKVAVVERQASIGGRMISLSKVYPTLDCASCITTPKMSAAAHHENIELLTYTEVDSISPGPHGHTVVVTRKPTYVNAEKCIGCRLCEYACDTEHPDDFEQDLGSVRAISVAFTNAIPQKAVLDADYCLACGLCLRACPTDAIEFDQQPRQETIHADTVIVASGFQLNALTIKPQYGADKNQNVISPLTLERLLAPHGPYGRVLRPSDGKIPDSIAFVQCAGSRDETIGVPYCSRVCCMYAIKQAMLLSGSLPTADITIYYMDIRAFGKGYEQFYQNAKAMGINFVRGKVSKIDSADKDDLLVHVELTEEAQDCVRKQRHDLVVLAQGMIPQWNPTASSPVHIGRDGFVATPDAGSPCSTNVPGIFVAGTAGGPKDIVDSIAEAGAAAMEAGRYLSMRGASSDSPRTVALELMA